MAEAGGWTTCSLSGSGGSRSMKRSICASKPVSRKRAPPRAIAASAWIWVTHAVVLTGRQRTRPASTTCSRTRLQPDRGGNPLISTPEPVQRNRSTSITGAAAQRSATRRRLLICLASLILLCLLVVWRNIAAPLSGRLGGHGGCGPCLRSWTGKGWQAHRVQQGKGRSGKLGLPARLGQAIGNQQATCWRGSGGDKST